VEAANRPEGGAMVKITLPLSAIVLEAEDEAEDEDDEEMTATDGQR
jgi:two-component system sensor histidine kinase RegB